MAVQRKFSHVLANSISLKDLCSPEHIPLSSPTKDGSIKEQGEPRTPWECKRRTELYHRMQDRARLVEERHDSVIDSAQAGLSKCNLEYHASHQERKDRWAKALHRAAGCDHRHAVCSSGSKTRRISVDVVQMPESGPENTAQSTEKEDQKTNLDSCATTGSGQALDGEQLRDEHDIGLGRTGSHSDNAGPACLEPGEARSSWRRPQTEREAE